MSSDTITLELDKYESGVVFHSLKDKRNQMLKEGKDTELVDDVLMKVIEKIEVPPEKEKRGRRSMKNDDEQSGLILAVIGIIPVIWFALLVAPYLSSGLMGILEGVPEAMKPPVFDSVMWGQC